MTPNLQSDKIPDPPFYLKNQDVRGMEEGIS
jgi:hypothetical protein